MIRLIAGAELKGFVAPFKDTGKPLNIDTFGLDWGQFVGPIPSKARLTVKMSAPLDVSDPGQRMLVAAGLDTAAIDLDLGAVWTEASRTFALQSVGQTLNMKLTPLGKVPALQLIQLLKTVPLVALAQFRIEASTGL